MPISISSACRKNCLEVEHRIKFRLKLHNKNKRKKIKRKDSQKSFARIKHKKKLTKMRHKQYIYNENLTQNKDSNNRR